MSIGKGDSGAIAPDGVHTLSARTILRVLGWQLLALWLAWWLLSIAGGQMFSGQLTWIPAWTFLGLDFYHNYMAVTAWLSGSNPYLTPFGDGRGLYAYPPVVLPLFAWCGLVSYWVATWIFMAFIASVAALAAWVSVRSRKRIGLSEIPASLAIAAVLLSMPVLFAMERGNCDAWVILLLVIAAWAMCRGKGVGWDLLAGVCLALAMWVKIYPALAILGLLALRRYRVFAVAVVMAGAISAVCLEPTREWVRVSQAAQESRFGPIQAVTAWFSGQEAPLPNALHPILGVVNHSVSTYWGPAWINAGMPAMARVPGFLIAALLLGPMMVWVSYLVFRSRAGNGLVYPYLLWVSLAATYLMPLSYDYNLIYLPLLLLALWGRRDSILAHVLMATSVLWWLPLALPIPTPEAVHVMFAAKVMSLMGVTISLASLTRGRTDQAGAFLPAT